VLVVSGVGAFDGPARSPYYPRLIEPSSMVSATALTIDDLAIDAHR